MLRVQANEEERRLPGTLRPWGSVRIGHEADRGDFDALGSIGLRFGPAARHGGGLNDDSARSGGVDDGRWDDNDHEGFHGDELGGINYHIAASRSRVLGSCFSYPY